MRPVGSEQPRGSGMGAVGAGDDQIDGMFVIELIQLVAALEDGDVPLYPRDRG
jgi:hypothetical protein